MDLQRAIERGNRNIDTVGDRKRKYKKGYRGRQQEDREIGIGRAAARGLRDKDREGNTKRTKK